MSKDSSRKRARLGGISIVVSEDQKTALYRSAAPVALTHNRSSIENREEAIVSHLYNAEAGHERMSFSREKVSHAILHRHDYFEFLFVKEGDISLRIEKRVHTLHPGELCLINRSTRHTEINDRDYTVIFLQLSVDFVKELLRELPSSEKEGVIVRFLMENLAADHPYKKDYLLCSPVKLFGPLEDPGFYLEQMEAEFSQGIPGCDLFIRGLTIRLLSKLQNPENYKTDYLQLSSSVEEEIYDRMIAIIDQRRGQITRNGLADELQYSGHYLNQIMKKYTGMTIISYAQQLRIRAAAELLKQTDESITDISSTLGFENRSYFYRIFKAQFGVTPAEYRAKL